MVYNRRLCRLRGCLRQALVRLPEDTLLLLLQYLPIVDLCKMRLVCKRFNNLIYNSPTLWIHTSFSTVWPCPENLHVFTRACDAGNIEAIIKMGISYLYNEGVSLSGVKKVSQVSEMNAKHAAMYFCAAENVTSNSVSFIWSFIRPPWAASAMCCKRHVFNALVKYCNETEDADPSILFSLGKIILLQDVEDFSEDCSVVRAFYWLLKAAEKGSNLAKFELWKYNISDSDDPALRIRELRELRECLVGNKEAELELALSYATGNIGNLDRETTAVTFRQFLASSFRCRRSRMFQFQTDLNRRMRYILVDWLIEVSTMKDFTCHILHAAVWYVDQFLLRRKIHRFQLQLLGIGCMLIASRFYGKDIVTIRESAWLTDNTYSYGLVVRMIGEIMGCLKGDTQVITIPNYVELFCELVKAERKEENVASYIADITLLQPSCENYSFALIALSCTLLGKLLCNPGTYVWCSDIEIYLPFDKQSVLACMNFLFEKCITKDYSMEQQTINHKAVKERYASPHFSEVSSMKMPSLDEMKELMQRFSPVVETAAVVADEDMLNSTCCSIPSSDYDGDEEDAYDDDDDEMMWYEDECVEQGTTGDQATKPGCGDQNVVVLDPDQVERSTPSFLSPGWLQSVVGQSSCQTARIPLGSNKRHAADVARVHCHSVGAVNASSAVHSRRPLVDVNHRHQSTGSDKAATTQVQVRFQPIDKNTPENLGGSH